MTAAGGKGEEGKPSSELPEVGRKILRALAVVFRAAGPQKNHDYADVFTISILHTAREMSVGLTSYVKQLNHRDAMQIRNARPSDIDSIIALDHITKLDPSRTGFIACAINTHTCLVAESLDRLLGYGVLEYTFFSNGFISMVYVAESERRQGIGSALLSALTDCCSTLKLFTSTNESNPAMQALLAKSGFIPSGVIYNLDPGDPERVYFKAR